ncbi:Wyosine [tRNA(Phe)-imidazoG37] synthetase, radical SAM superfamily [Desulfocicer vacuolatum DSM 3385]|uniref:Wyosine [tRNA(Phe)-imidazoG37] synthetase, radical SAM superfamily n=1 Tax=Desulfocicer vacuolatum DSM 3385 TaxID=1121400 RepID=A0A1W2CKH7_9BACT|nr:radical SAM protein [Desulfocicer vacuolatum]SMC85526.1 Wyosine [tRNA(Phe)-imidazoG37] synthetase, radical SAM superfamily [Desulfocicer vacuolatum DSM 3385]
MYQHLFGPVPSRRLGMSLGVDLVTHKICSLDCIYCECGRTTELTVERKEYVPHDAVIKELDDYFKQNPDPDYITFSGSGEPTLSARIGDVIAWIKDKKPGVSIAVLTNGTLLCHKEVREALLPADLVMPSLDAALVSSFQKINRPCAKINLDHYIKGIADFQKAYTGKLALEILILPGVNDSREDLTALKQACDTILPDVIQLNTLDRPGAVSDISAATHEKLLEIQNFLGKDRVEIIAAAAQRRETKAYRNDMESAILETIHRRPCTPEDLASILGTHINDINKYLSVLEGEGTIESMRQDRGVFYQTCKK